MDGFTPQVLVMIGIVIAAWSALLLSIIKWFLKGYHNDIKERFKALGEAFSGQSAELNRIEKDFLRFQAALPNEYVRREDAIREQVVIGAKLDALNLRVENLSLMMRGQHDN